MELAIETGTAPSAWWDEDPAVIATAVTVLDRKARAMKAAIRRGR